MADVYEEVLNTYTTIFENCRYDRLSYDTGNSTIADIATNTHTVNNENYRSYGTYRHDIFCDSSFVKINETYISEKNIINNFYDIDSNTNFQFPGCVLSKLFSTNGNEASLEDIFAEYGYKYLKAYDSYLKNTLNASIGYFDVQTDDDDNDFVDGEYSILNIGEKFTNHYELVYDETLGKYIEPIETIQYDGTYVPTVKELLSGNLYIVIKSGSLDPRKIYFNNKYMPSLFINDDKYVKSNNQAIDKYVIDEYQLMKLCDITLHERIGCSILWEDLVYIKNLKTIASDLSGLGFDLSNIYIRTFYTANYSIPADNSGSTTITTTLIDGVEIPNHNDNNALSLKTYNNDAATEFKYPGSYFLNADTGSINLKPSIVDTDKQKITLSLKFGLELVIYGYTTTRPETPLQEETHTYKLYWNEVVNSTTPITPAKTYTWNSNSGTNITSESITILTTGASLSTLYLYLKDSDGTTYSNPSDFELTDTIKTGNGTTNVNAKDVLTLGGPVSLTGQTCLTISATTSSGITNTTKDNTISTILLNYKGTTDETPLSIDVTVLSNAPYYLISCEYGTGSNMGTLSIDTHTVYSNSTTYLIKNIVLDSEGDLKIYADTSGSFNVATINISCYAEKTVIYNIYLLDKDGNKITDLARYDTDCEPMSTNDIVELTNFEDIYCGDLLLNVSLSYIVFTYYGISVDISGSFSNKNNIPLCVYSSAHKILFLIYADES